MTGCWCPLYQSRKWGIDVRSVRSGESTSTSTARTILQILRSAKQATRLKQIYLWAYRIVYTDFWFGKSKNNWSKSNSALCPVPCGFVPVSSLFAQSSAPMLHTAHDFNSPLVMFDILVKFSQPEPHSAYNIQQQFMHNKHVLHVVRDVVGNQWSLIITIAHSRMLRRRLWAKGNIHKKRWSQW